MNFTPQGVLKPRVLLMKPYGADHIRNIALRIHPLAKERAGSRLRTLKEDAMRLSCKKWNNKGQNLLEYALVAALVSAAVVAMSTYVFRSVQATQQMIQKEFSQTE